MTSSFPNSEVRLRVIDSHTGGEPTRVVIEGAPKVGGTPAEVRDQLRSEHDWMRTALVTEPRASEAAVGALLLEPSKPDCAAGVVFFNNVGYLNMCVHGTIGVVETLRWLGRIGPGQHQIETPVGDVCATLEEGGRISIANVPSYRHATQVAIEVEGFATAHGDIAWGGNWFFLIDDHGQDVRYGNLERLTDYAIRAREALVREGITGAGGMEIDHIELFVPAPEIDADSRNFVLCPGAEYDRSPCGTGTSAKLACLYADGKLAEGDTWKQAGILGSCLEGRIERRGNDLIPHVAGTASVNAETTVIISPKDPFRFGISPGTIA